ncbi:MAG: hypothetical protein ACLR23_15445 [Clostridia bacterium]
MQGVDQKVQAVEDSVRLIFTEQSTMNYLTQTDFNHPDGLVHEAYRRVDWVLNSFQQQFPQFVGMLFYNGKESIYKYNYYNPSLDAIKEFLTPEVIDENTQTDRFSWKGVYPVNNQIAQENAYIVTRNFVDYQNLNRLRVIVILLEEDVFSAIYRPIKGNQRGPKCIYSMKPISRWKAMIRLPWRTCSEIFRGFKLGRAMWCR